MVRDEGAPVCPVCGCLDTYELITRRRFKCAARHRQFSVTSGTIFASRKVALDLHRFCSGQMLMLGGSLFEGRG